MGQIRVLPPNLVNRIAAGECVERPASVVKELVENALDAGARKIEVRVLDGGRGLVQVADDGRGMDPDDLRLSVAAHATSKIQVDDDLFRIQTLGFRGEALASIGAVARVQITSRRHDAEVAHTLRCEGGVATAPVPCAAPPGTTVAVRDLFYSVPARRKFLRTNPTEMGHITEQFARIALAHPGVAFTLAHQDRVVHALAAAAEPRRRIEDFYGPELAGVLLPFGRESGGVGVSGLAAPPAQCRKTAKWEYVFVNGRYVRDRFVSHAIREAYRSLLHPDEHPVVFLFITIAPDQVDVNVHPSKVEVRWRDSNYVHAQVLAALREKFLATNLDRTLRPPAADDEAYRQRIRTAMVDFFTRVRAGDGLVPHAGGGGAAVRPAAVAEPHLADAHAPAAVSAPVAGDPVALRAGGAALLAPHPPQVPPSAAAAAACGPALAPAAVPITAADPAIASAPAASPGPAQAELLPPQLQTRAGPPRFVQIHNTYLVAETEDGLMIIDQHALHERILYEELRQRITTRPLESQRLLIPEIVRVAPDRVAALEAHAETLARLGLQLTPAGPRSVAVHAFPTLLERAAPAAFVADLLDLLAEAGHHGSSESLIHAILDLAACKAAVKAGDPLSTAEIEALLARRMLAERASHCPHGRPTTLRLSLHDLERQFKRR